MQDEETKPLTLQRSGPCPAKRWAKEDGGQMNLMELSQDVLRDIKKLSPEKRAELLFSKGIHPFGFSIKKGTMCIDCNLSTRSESIKKGKNKKETKYKCEKFKQRIEANWPGCGLYK